MSFDIATLKSGTDVRGRAIAGDGEEAVLTPEICGLIAEAFLFYVKEKYGIRIKKLAVGRDSRLSGPAIADGIAAALSRYKLTLLDCGVVSTPSMFMMTRFPETDCDAAIMITASHLPFYMNGMKFFLKSGGFAGSDITALLKCAAEGKCLSSGAGFKRLEDDYLSLYCEFLKNKIIAECGTDKPFAGLKIPVDAGNGAGGFYAERILKPLGADISASRFLDPDGRFPGHIPNPENKEAMASAREMAVGAGADIGIIFDTDVDRAAVIAGDGTEINRNRLIALCAALLSNKHRGAVIVTDSVTNLSLTGFIEKAGCVHHRFKRGYKNVIDEAVRLNSEGIDAVLAIETSGHAAFRDNYFLDDGAYLVTFLLINMCILKREGRALLDLIADFDVPAEELELRLKIAAPDFREAGEEALKELERAVAALPEFTLMKSYEGVRAAYDTPEYGKGCATVRLSLHEPLLPVNIESDLAGGCAAVRDRLLTILSETRALKR